MESLKRYQELTIEALEKERWQQLARCLSDLRKPESSDVILLCGDREFYVHKNVLEASSSYFVTMFNSGLEEAKSGRILFNEVEPETLEIILDFMYLGNVVRMNSEDQVKKVLVNAHLMQLKELFHYCCGALEVVISAENFSELWAIGLKYEQNSLTLKVMKYVENDINQLSGAKVFLMLSRDQIQGFLQFLKDTRSIRSSDLVLQALVRWLIHDPEGRDKLAGELFAFIDVRMVSKEYLTSLLKNEQVMKSSVEIANRMNELGIAKFIC